MGAASCGCKRARPPESQPLEEEPATKNVAAISGSSMAACVYAVVGLCFAGALLIPAVQTYPVWPLRLEDAAWADRWLRVAVGSYFAIALCFCGIIIATEADHCHAAFSCLRCALFGSPFTCAYLVAGCLRGSLTLRSMHDGQHGASAGYERPDPDDRRMLTPRERTVVSPRESNPCLYLAGVIYAVLALGISCYLVLTAFNHPPFPLRESNVEWVDQWLRAAAANYFAAVACVCGVMLSTEEAWRAVLWCLAAVVLGAPAACIYMAYRSCAHGTLALAVRAPRPF